MIILFQSIKTPPSRKLYTKGAFFIASLESLSCQQLAGYMTLLKRGLAFFDAAYRTNVVFYDNWSLYQHVRVFPIPATGITLGALLDKLEPYIPMPLTNSNHSLLMECAYELAPELPSYFDHKARIDFMLAVRAIEDQVQWERALAVCEAIRQLKTSVEYETA